MATSPTPGFRTRSGQREFERFIDLHRISAFLTRRQYGKTTTASRIALKKMMRTAGHTVVFGSIKLDLGREIVRKESEAMHRAIAVLSQQADAAQTKLSVVDSRTGRDAGGLADDDFADVYESSRLEFRLYHSRTIYSRTKVVALTPDAVGETGDLILDEVGRVRNFRAVWEAVKPIIASNPLFRCMLTTTPPPDDSHYSFELLAPPIGHEFAVNPVGNAYRSELGVHVLRVTAWDAAADGVPLYDDDTGEPITPEESRRKDPDKDAWDRNYGVEFKFGGTAAVGLLQLDAAQRRGIGRCACIQVETDADYHQALRWISGAGRLPDGQRAIGIDLATTEKATSNPTVVAVAVRCGVDVTFPLVVVWKTRDPAIARERIELLLRAVPGLRRVCVDATSERYFAADLQRELAPLAPIELVVASETVEQPGSESITKKALLGNQYVAEIDDNHVTLPPERYLRDDHRLVKRDRGSFTTDLGTAGEHGDTFDACKLALHGLTSNAGAIATMEGIRFARPVLRRALVNPPRRIR